MTVQLGIDVLRARGFDLLRGRRVGLLTTFAAVDSDLRRTYDLLRTDERVRLAALFAPEHGLSGVGQAGEAIASARDSRTGLPVYSLYGATFRPSLEMLADIDVIVFDIADVGARYFTFLWTLAEVMAAARDVEIVVLDRPNPLGGERIEGGALDPALISPVGGGVPVCHGMTMGELARLLYASCDESFRGLTVVPCDGWRRAMTWAETGLLWSPPSPNMPRFETALHYPGACLIEGTTLSEGRGTPLPFEIVGAPYIDEVELADALTALKLTGARFRPHVFKPTASKWAGEVCKGVQVYITDRAAWRPIDVWLNVIIAIRRLYPAQFAWLPPGESVEGGQAIHHFDRLIGTSAARMQIESGAAAADVMAEWADYQAAFRAFRQPFLLYD